jgi:hypothetical protein
MRALLQDYLVINSAGLTLDVAGVMLLFRFGLPEAVRRAGLAYWNGDEEKMRLYDRLGRAGLALLIGGFLLQLLSNAMQRHWLGLPWW